MLTGRGEVASGAALRLTQPAGEWRSATHERGGCAQQGQLRTYPAANSHTWLEASFLGSGALRGPSGGLPGSHFWVPAILRGLLVNVRDTKVGFKNEVRTRTPFWSPLFEVWQVPRSLLVAVQVIISEFRNCSGDPSWRLGGPDGAEDKASRTQKS